MVANLITPSVSPMPVREADVRSQLKLSLRDYSVNGASIGHGPGGTQFACTIGPLSDATVAALDGAARVDARICLLLPEPLLLDVVAPNARKRSAFGSLDVSSTRSACPTGDVVAGAMRRECL